MLRQKNFSACINYVNPLSLCLHRYVCKGECADIKNINGYNYVPLPHDTKYSVKVKNHNNSRARMTLNIDGKEMGIWILSPYQIVDIKRGVDVDREFIFLRETSYKYIQAGGKVGDTMNGVVSITLVPEGRIYTSLASPLPALASSSLAISSGDQTLMRKSYEYASGGTVLGGKTNQRFGTTSDIYPEDSEGETTFIFRLVVEDPPMYLPSYTAINRDIPPRIEYVR